MANYASLRGPVGMNRVFARSGATLDYRAWLAALKGGRTFVSNGPLLSFSVDGHEAGDEIRLPEGAHELTARVSMRSIAPVERVEIVGNGVVVATIPIAPGATQADATVKLFATHSGWYTLRAWSPDAVEPVLDIYPFATTSPVYVTVAGRPVRSAADARYFIAWIERVEAAAAAHKGWNGEKEKAEVLGRLAAAKDVYRRLADEAAR
jgi:hypothetical protein